MSLSTKMARVGSLYSVAALMAGRRTGRQGEEAVEKEEEEALGL
jgi:hypothetical protein